jgi:thiol:disulfide interchange protein DsbA
MFARILAATLLFAGAAQAQVQSPQPFTEGVDYARLARVMPVSTGEQVEVIEFFSYACIHCAEIEPHLQRWKASAPANAKLVYYPAVFNADWELAARAFYASETMGTLEQTHKATFDARFVERKAFPTIESYADLYATKGVDRSKFLAVAKSFAVNNKLARSKKMALEFDVSVTPTLIVDGKYRLIPKGFAQVPELINFVVAKAAAERGSP